MKKKILAIALGVLTLLCMTTTACNNSDSPVSTPTLIVLKPGEFAYVAVEDETGWTSDDACVTVEGTGKGQIKIVAVQPGSACVSKGNTVYKVTVPQASSADGFTPKKDTIIIDLSVGSSAQIEIEGRETGEFTYTVADQTVAGVEADGTVRGRKEGVTFVTVTEKASGVNKRVNVAVYGVAEPVKSVQTAGTGGRSYVAGVAVDRYAEYFYFSMKDRFIKQAADGEIVGSIVGFDGEINDIAYNPQDGRVYAAMSRSNTEQKCFLMMIDVDKLTKKDTPAQDVCTLVYVGAPIAALANVPEGTYGQSKGGKFGITESVFSVAIGPSMADPTKTAVTLGSTSPGFSVAEENRQDNRYSLLFQFDMQTILTYEKPYGSGTLDGPPSADVYFAKTNFHDWGVRSLCYDANENVYILTAYKFNPNWNSDTMFFVLDPTNVTEQKIEGTEETGKVVATKYGLFDTTQGTVGYTTACWEGICSAGGGRFYVGGTDTTDEISFAAKCDLYLWALNENNKDTAKACIVKAE